MPNQLQWQQVDAPRLDTRDLAIAGQTVDNAFGRFAEILNARDDRLNKKATDSVAAQLMSARSPAELAALQAQVASGAFGSRVNAREVAGIGNQREADMLQNAARQQQMDIGKEDLLNKQDFATHAEGYTAYDRALAQGDRAGADAIATQIKAAGGGRNLYSVGQDGEKLFGDWRDAGERKRVDDANIANARGHLALAQRQDARQQQKEQWVEDGITQAGVFANKYRTRGKDAAVAMTADDADFKKLNPQVQQFVLANIGAQHDRINASTSEAYAATNDVRGQANRENTAAEADANRRLNALNTPLVQATEFANDPKNANITMGQLVDTFHAADPKIFKSWSRDNMQEMLTSLQNEKELQRVDADGKNPKPYSISNAQVMAAINMTAPLNGTWTPGDGGYTRAVKDNLRNIVQEDIKGNNANVQLERGSITGSLQAIKDGNQSKVDSALAKARERQSRGETLTPTKYTPPAPVKAADPVRVAATDLAGQQQEFEDLRQKQLLAFTGRGPQLSPDDSARFAKLRDKFGK